MTRKLDPPVVEKAEANGSRHGEAEEWKQRGNKLYGEGQYDQAVTAYQAGLQVLDEEPEQQNLSIPLRANLAMTLLKLEKYQDAENECTFILERQPQHVKALYRRAMAREGMSRRSELSGKEQKDGFIMAMDDIQKCLSQLDQGDDQSKENIKLKKAAQSTMDRLEMAYRKFETPKTSNPVSGATNSSTSNAHDTSERRRPTAAKQKQDVMRLLMARQTGGKIIPAGEAFFLIDWKWWCRWCKDVDFFYNTSGTPSKDSKTMARIQKVLQLLPDGAILPSTRADSDDSDDSSSDEEEDVNDQPLGAIDNSRLILDPSIYHSQWYLKDSHQDEIILQPNLVRGHHFELLPREVYCAFRSWYGEITPSLCRRTSRDGIVPVYKSLPIPTEGVLRSKSQKCSGCGSRGAVSRCRNCMSVQYCDRSCQEAHWPFHKVLCKLAAKNGTKLPPNTRAGGRVGLNNLGNTCFMNSALQSLSHAAPLTRHFLSNRFKGDLNASNPLGTGGKLATAYEAVMKEIWMKQKGTSFSPTALKRAIALFAPRFAGCLQHDAQEFLAYLLDGLHEDLNRIRKAPYVEMPDVTDGQNMAIAGAEAWDAHKRRNDSLVLDTFYGQFQSTCICPQCDRVSVSFDAFNHVSLEIPQVQKATVTIPVLVLRKPSSSGSNEQPAERTPLRYGITLRRQCIVADLKQALASQVGIPPTHMVLADIYESTIYELINDKKPLANIRPNDVIVAFEVAPYDNTSIHMVATQSLLVKDKNGKDHRPNFGFPFMSSIDGDSTCREVWDHVWGFVDHLVEQEGCSPGYIDADNRFRREDLLTIRVVTSQGRPIPVFSTEEGTTTSIVPFDADEKLRDALGDGCTENFLFLSVEWIDPGLLNSEEEKLISPQAFAAFTDHPSLVDAVRQERLAGHGQKAVTLEQCLETFTKPERLDENNKWYCSNCKEHVRAMKTMKLWRLPNILVLHLKRFEFKHALRRDKLSTFVDFPLQGLDMGPHCEDWDKAGGNAHTMVDTTVGEEYDLFAVVNHFGRMGFGHYTAFCRQWDEFQLSSEWNLFDDSSVQQVQSTDVVSQAAYVLFYRRREFH